MAGNEKENLYLQLVDMFMDVVEPSIIQMVLQNQNWDLDAALEDIMTLASPSQADKSKLKLTQSGLENISFSGSHRQTDYVPDVPHNLANSPLHLQRSYKKSVCPDQSNTNKLEQNFLKTINSVQITSDANIGSGQQIKSSQFLEQYKFVKSIPIPYNRAVMLIKDGVKLMVILRGPPGSGKSHLARTLLIDAGINLSEHKKHIFCTDNYFVRRNIYNFVPELLHQAHTWNQRNVASAVRDQISPVIVDNTNTEVWEMKVYADLAVSAGYHIEILEPNTWWIFNDRELARRSVHNVPKAKIRIMVDRYEKDITAEVMLNKCKLRYSLSNVPPQSVPKSKWKDKLSGQTNIKSKKKKKTVLTNNCQSDRSTGDLMSFPPDPRECGQSTKLPLPDEQSKHSLPRQKNGDTFSYTGIDELDTRKVISSGSISKHSLNSFVQSESNLIVSLPSTNPFLPGVNSAKNDKALLEGSSPDEFKRADDKSSGNNTSDCMAEFKKFVAALAHSETPRNELEPTLKEATILNTESPQPSISNNIPLVPTFVDVNQNNDIYDLEDNKSKNDSNSFTTKIIDSVQSISVVKDNTTKHIEKKTQRLNVGNSVMWEYVLVNDDGTFTYKRNDYNPIPLKAGKHGESYQPVTTVTSNDGNTVVQVIPVVEDTITKHIGKQTQCLNTDKSDMWKYVLLYDNGKSNKGEKSHQEIRNATSDKGNPSSVNKTHNLQNSDMYTHKNVLGDLNSTCVHPGSDQIQVFSNNKLEIDCPSPLNCDIYFGENKFNVGDGNDCMTPNSNINNNNAANGDLEGNVTLSLENSCDGIKMCKDDKFESKKEITTNKLDKNTDCLADNFENNIGIINEETNFIVNYDKLSEDIHDEKDFEGQHSLNCEEKDLFDSGEPFFKHSEDFNKDVNKRAAAAYTIDFSNEVNLRVAESEGGVDTLELINSYKSNPNNVSNCLPERLFNEIQTTESDHLKDNCKPTESCGTKEMVNGETHSDVLFMMETILKSMSPLCENSTVAPPTKIINSSQIESRPNSYGESSEPKEEHTLIEGHSGSKPPHNISRSNPKTLVFSPFQSETKEMHSEFQSWDSVPNHFEDWNGLKNLSSTAKDEAAAALPQRARIKSKKLISSATNTNYEDFLNLKHDNLLGLKTLEGHCRNITESIYDIKQELSQTLFLDKSTMTTFRCLDSVDKYDIAIISNLFPKIPQKYIFDMIDRCHGDVNWAVDLLLDSEHSIYENTEVNDTVCNITSPKSEQVSVSNHIIQEIVDNNENVSFNKSDDTATVVLMQEQAKVKKMIENCIVISKSHYSDKMLKMLKRRNPKYASLVENSQPQLDKSDDKGPDNNEVLSSDNVGTKDYGSDEANSCSDSYDTEDDVGFEVVINNDLILQLHQTFGNSNMPELGDMTPVVKLPLSLARQLHGYIMDTIQTNLEEEQDNIENLISQDEEIARMLENRDCGNPQLQEIMDMEMALEMYKTDQEEMAGTSDSTVAAKLSKNILLEKFPHVDPKALMAIFHAHNYSLHDTEASLKLTLGLECATATPHTAPHSTKEVEDGFPEDLSQEAQTHRQHAASYYSLRVEYLRKAQEAFRTGNKTVASYYSQLAEMQKKKIEICNSQAAACLMSSHKKGSNTLDLHFLHVMEAKVVLDMFLDETIRDIVDTNKKRKPVFLITGRGLRSVGGVSRIKPMVLKKLSKRNIFFAEVNPGMISAVVQASTPLSHTSE